MPFCNIPAQPEQTLYQETNGHWIAVFLNFNQRAWAVFDSANTFQPSTALYNRIASLVNELTGMWDGPGWDYVHLAVPQQDDGYNCGVYTIENVCVVLQGNLPPDPAAGGIPFDPTKQRAYYVHRLKDELKDS